LISDGSARWVSMREYLCDGSSGGFSNALNILDNLN